LKWYIIQEISTTQTNFSAHRLYHLISVPFEGRGKMKITVRTFLFTKRYMDIDACHNLNYLTNIDKQRAVFFCTLFKI
jgi:hypothetical protein